MRLVYRGTGVLLAVWIAVGCSGDSQQAETSAVTTSGPSATSSITTPQPIAESTSTAISTTATPSTTQAELFAASLDDIQHVSWRCETGESSGLQVCNASTDDDAAATWSCNRGTDSADECFGSPFTDHPVEWSCARDRDGEQCESESWDFAMVWTGNRREQSGALNTTLRLESSSPPMPDWTISCTFTGEGAGGGYRCSGGPDNEPDSWLWNCIGNEVGTWVECSGYLTPVALIVEAG